MDKSGWKGIISSNKEGFFSSNSSYIFVVFIDIEDRIMSATTCRQKRPQLRVQCKEINTPRSSSQPN